jgi:REP element-mobilizing transposase RayT
MPRGPRLDAPGTLHHVIVRGIEQGVIVQADEDRKDFVSRMGTLAKATGTEIYAWALMSNHAHILLRSGDAGLSVFMRKLMTGYATLYNRRHKRAGHLFQNRYRSIVCEEASYFFRLVSYIHLNPIRAGLVPSLQALERYPWSGHAVLMGRIVNDWQERDYVLRLFGNHQQEAIEGYRKFLEEQRLLGKQPQLTGGGLIRSLGGWSEVKSSRIRGEQQFSDERILGSGEFVQGILDQAEASIRAQIPVRERQRVVDELLEKRCREAGISIAALQAGSKMRLCGALRKDLVPVFVQEYGLSYAEAARKLGVSTSAVSQILRRL